MFHAVSGMLCCNEQRASEFLAEAEAAEEAEAEEPRILQRLALNRGRFVEG